MHKLEALEFMRIVMLAHHQAAQRTRHRWILNLITEEQFLAKRQRQERAMNRRYQQIEEATK